MCVRVCVCERRASAFRKIERIKKKKKNDNTFGNKKIINKIIFVDRST